MDLKQALKKLESSNELRKWHSKNKNTYFSYAFLIPQEMNDEWQLGFYDKKKDKITTFVISGNKISIRPEEEVFKEEDKQVNEVHIEKVKIAFDDASSIASSFQSKNYPSDKSVKTIAILQNIEEFGNIWNITYITESFNTLNMKIDASSGKMIEHKLSSVLSFRKE